MVCGGSTAFSSASDITAFTTSVSCSEPASPDPDTSNDSWPGQMCSTEGDKKVNCAAGSECKEGACVATDGAEGKTCDVDGAASAQNCDVGFYCQSSDKTCQKILDAGADCSTNAADPGVCGYSSVCVEWIKSGDTES